MNWIENKIVNHYLGKASDGMSAGWKGKAGGIGSMLAGVGGILSGLSNGDLTTTSFMQFFGYIALGLSTFGIRQALGPGVAGDLPILTPTLPSNPNKQTGPAAVG